MWVYSTIRVCIRTHVSFDVFPRVLSLEHWFTFATVVSVYFGSILISRYVSALMPVCVFS
jgi:hypothetical protein